MRCETVLSIGWFWRARDRCELARRFGHSAICLRSRMPRQHGNCKFRDEWLCHERYRHWVAKDRSDDTMARCTLCMKQISVANAGKYGLDSHANSVLHRQNEACRNKSPSMHQFASSTNSHVPVPTTGNVVGNGNANNGKGELNFISAPGNAKFNDFVSS